MKNKRSKDGRINREGTADSSSYIVDPRDSNFLDEIEDGVFDTILALRQNGVITFSSCEGHHSPRTVSIVIEFDELGVWSNYVDHINANFITFPITYIVLPAPPHGLFNFIDELFIEPVIMMIDFGIKEVDSLKLCEGQNAFNNNLPLLKSMSTYRRSTRFERGIESHVNTYSSSG